MLGRKAQFLQCSLYQSFYSEYPQNQSPHKAQFSAEVDNLMSQVEAQRRWNYFRFTLQIEYNVTNFLQYPPTMVAEMLQKSTFLLCFIFMLSFILTMYFTFMLHILLCIYYIFICTLHVFYFCYMFLFSHYLILNLCDNIYIFIIFTKLL